MSKYRTLLLFALLISSNLSACIDCNNIAYYVDHRIKTLLYTSDQVFTVNLSYGFCSYIEFAEGEKILTISVGDESSWNLMPYDNKLLIIPFEYTAQTNMMITTTKKRSYVFDLVSRPYCKHNFDEIKNDACFAEESITYIIRFCYPKESEQNALDRFESLKVQSSVYQTEEIIQENNTINHYQYTDEENNNRLIPFKIFDDGLLTYLKLSDLNIIPQILVVDENNAQMRCYCRRLFFDGYIVIKGVYKKLFIYYQNNELKVVNTVL
ncbi:TrbG/VirB9 family P-type conjugative transfer protein [Wolbachia endosymbiont of Howardula sp.]|uniref:TrbG/VirB9 family P-type conjugative transfer protein n=1 Tax=Wolbachia endosymbiont of Howardula sp. TaxID=2916816 RepID=UPI00217ED29B|nr:TrbG/VirB9 family P-type conjugative transfer protein [Wolbachia endosymbiont of Howardula sp.]UWI82963.1 TrbG/VirB9 family P-type conjugative transfer protein [Wolbachia endosymbiont of Howardula sp.]